MFTRFAAALSLLLLMLCPALAEKRVALVIGNANYVNANPLNNTLNDAAGMAEKLRSLGFEVTTGKDVSMDGMRSTVRNFLKSLEGADVAMLFYAGHGLQVNGVNYMVPIDAKLETEDDVAFESLALDTVLQPMERVAKVNLVFLDACRDNPLAKNLARSMGTRSAAVGRGLARIGSGVGTLISFSTQPGNVALDGDGKNSPFTTALLKHLGTPGQDITRDLVMVRRDVLDATSGKQVPWDNSSLTGDVILKSGPETTPVILDEKAVETAFWNSVKNESDPAFFEKYLARYPKGEFADLARLKMKQVEKARSSAVAPVPQVSKDAKVASLGETPKVESAGPQTFDGMWSLTRSARKADCVWSSMETFIEINNGKIDHPDLKGIVNADGSIKLTLTFIDEFNGEKGSNIFAGKMTPDGGNGKFFKPGGGCKGTFKLVRQ